MKKQKLLLCILSIIFLISIFCLPVLSQNKQSYNSNEIKLQVGGIPFGAKIISNGLTVVKFSSTDGENASSAYQAGIREGDIITKINEKEINPVEDYVKIINKSGGNQLKFTVIRNQKELCFNVFPKYSNEDGKYKTGIWVKDSTSGIGTITFIDPQTQEFGGLGHGICDSGTGKIVPIKQGIVSNVTINGVEKGQVGDAGELKGSFNNQVIGSLTKNTACGVFGKLLNGTYSSQELLPICTKNQVKEGEAYIWCTLDGNGPQKYNIQICDIDTSGSNTKNFKIKITDSKLLELTGGIVQGMSGSPIVQNGKLVGAVTHVLISDPTSGYGIFIENMLNQMKN